MGFLSKLFSGGSPSPSDHPSLPAGVDQFFPGGHPRAYHASTTVRGQALGGGGVVFRSGAGSSFVSQADADQQARVHAERHLSAALGSAGAPFDAYAYATERS